MQHKYQIFLSSTYKDLIEERQVAINKIMKLHQIPAGMELFGAVGVKQWEYIRREIDNSDYYLLLLAGKYGSVNEEGIGYTEAEYNYARKMGKHIIPFLVKDLEVLPRVKCENDRNRWDQLQRFRKKIEKEAGLVAYWTDIHDLDAKIGEGLANVMRDYPAKTRWVRVADNKEQEIVFETSKAEEEEEVVELFPEVRNIPISEPTVNYDVHDPSKAVVICESSYVQIEVRDGRIEKYMIHNCKEFVKLLKQINKYMEKHERLCLRKIWFNTQSPEVLVYVDYLRERGADSRYTVKEIKKIFYDGKVMGDGVCYNTLVRVIPADMKSDRFFINDKVFYEENIFSKYE